MNQHAKKRFVAFVSFCLFCLAGLPLMAQENTVTIDVRNASLRQVFDVIEKQTTYRFAYQDVVIDNRKDISLSKKNASVPAVLDIALKGRDMTYTIVSSKSIVITPKQVASAQASVQRQVTGTVTDANGEPIIGANVLVKGESGKGVITDYDGNFAITVSSDAVLEFSYIGYSTIALPREWQVCIDGKTERRPTVVG